MGGIFIGLAVSMAMASPAGAQPAYPGQMPPDLPGRVDGSLPGMPFGSAERAQRPPSLGTLDARADKNDAEALFILANIYTFGQLDQSVDYGRALKYLKASADLDYLPAVKNLAQAYWRGGVAPKDVGLAIKYYTVAAEKGDVYSMTQLGSIYQLGDLDHPGDMSKRDFPKAVFWYEKAAAAGDAMGLFNLAGTYKMTEPLKAVEAYKRLADHDDSGFLYVIAVENLADLYYAYDDRGIAKNLPEAFRLSRIAAMLGNAEAQHRLGAMYYQAEATPQDDIQAYTWLKLSAENGDYAGKSDYETVRDQITPAQMKTIDANIAALRKDIAKQMDERQARYVRLMAGKGVLVIPPKDFDVLGKIPDR